MTWAHEELRHVDLGDKRLDRRLPRLVDAFLRRAEASLPQALPRWADAKAAYRFFDNDRVSPEAIFDAQAHATVARMDGHRRVLAVQDTTSLDYTHHPATEGLGYLDRAFLSGFFLHSTLAVSTDGLPLGLVGGHLWARTREQIGKKHTRRSRPTSCKESARWLDAEARTWSVTPEAVEVVSEADREADREADLGDGTSPYDLFAQARPARAHLLVRVAHNRRTLAAAGSEAGPLFAALAEAPVAGAYTVEVGRRGERPPRVAVLRLRYREVAVLAPRRASGAAVAEAPRSVCVRAVEALEEAPPAGEAAVHWRLLTTLPVGSFDEARTVVRYYSLRWLVERFHLVLESGCRVERLQLETAARLERAVATLSVVAWRLLHVAVLCRVAPASSCEAVLARSEWESLWAVQEGRVPERAPTLREAVVLIACLGGFLNRRRDGPPGVQVLWRGLRRLGDLAVGWEVAQVHKPPLVGNA